MRQGKLLCCFARSNVHLVEESGGERTDSFDKKQQIVCIRRVVRRTYIDVLYESERFDQGVLPLHPWSNLRCRPFGTITVTFGRNHADRMFRPPSRYLSGAREPFP